MKEEIQGLVAALARLQEKIDFYVNGGAIGHKFDGEERKDSQPCRTTIKTNNKQTNTSLVTTVPAIPIVPGTMTAPLERRQVTSKRVVHTVSANETPELSVSGKFWVSNMNSKSKSRVG